MGDRTWVNVRIGGHLADRAAFDKLIEQIMDYGGTSMHMESLHEEFLTSILHPTNSEFSFTEVDWGTLTPIEEVCSELGLYYQADNGEGAGFSAGCKIIYPKESGCRDAGQTYSFSACEGEPVISAPRIRRLRENGKLDEELRKMDLAGGLQLPSLSAAPEVVAYLRIMKGRAA